MKILKNTAFVLTVTAMALTHHNYAQNLSTDLEEVKIISNWIDIPINKQDRNVIILNAETIKQIPSQSLNELISFINGVDVRKRGLNNVQSDIGINGGGFDQTLVLLNGSKMSNAQTGHNMMNLPINLNAIERIEILKGPATTIYGVNALYGVINIVTKKSDKDALFFDSYAGSNFKKDTASSNTYNNIGAQATLALNSQEAVNHLISIGHDRSNGYRHNTHYNISKAYYNNQLSLGKSTIISSQIGFVHNDFGANSFYAPPHDKESIEELQNFIVGTNANIMINKKWILNSEINYSYNTDDYILNKNDVDLYHNTHKNNVIDLSLGQHYYSSIGKFSLGVNYRGEHIQSSNLGKNDRNNFGIYANYQSVFFDKLNLNLGTYLNMNSVFGHKIYPAINIGYDINEYWHIYSHIGTGQRLPTFTDLYYEDRANIGNPNLKPEFLVNYEVGAKYNNENFNVNATVFYNDGKDFIDWIRQDSLSKWQPVNFLSIQTFGFNFDVRNLYKINNFITILPSIGYTYLDPKILDNTDAHASKQSKYMLNALNHQIHLSIVASLNKKLDLSIYNRTAQRFSNKEKLENYRLDGYNLLDLKIAYHLKQITLYCTANNVLDVQYIEAGVVPMPGLWLSVGAKWQPNIFAK